MATISDLKGTTNNSFRIGNGATIIQGDVTPKEYLGKIGDIYLCTANGILYIKNKKDGHDNGIWESFKTYYFDDPIIDDNVSTSGTDHTITIQQSSKPSGDGITDLTVTQDVITGAYHDNYGVVRFATDKEAKLGKLTNVAISPATLGSVVENAIVYHGIWGIDSSSTYSFFETYRQSLPTGIIKAGSMWFVGGLPVTTNPSYYTGSFDTPAVGSYYKITIDEPTASKTYTTDVVKTNDQTVDDDNLKHWCEAHYLTFISRSEVRESPWCKIGDVIYEYGDHVIFAKDWDGTVEITPEILNKFDSTESTDLVRLDAHQTLTNKQIDADNNFIKNIRVVRTDPSQASNTTDFADGVIQNTLRDGTTATNSSLATEKAIRTAVNLKQNNLNSGDLKVGNFLKLAGSSTDEDGNTVVTTIWQDYIPDIPLFSFQFFDHDPTDSTGWVESDYDIDPLSGTLYTTAFNLLKTQYEDSSSTTETDDIEFTVTFYGWKSASNDYVYTESDTPIVGDLLYTFDSSTQDFTLVSGDTVYSVNLLTTPKTLYRTSDTSKKYENDDFQDGNLTISITYKLTPKKFKIADNSSQFTKIKKLYSFTGSSWYYTIIIDSTTPANNAFTLPKSKNYIKGGDGTDGLASYHSGIFGDVTVWGEEVSGDMSYNQMNLYFYLGNRILNQSSIDVNEVLEILNHKENTLVAEDTSIVLTKEATRTLIKASTGGVSGGDYNTLTNKPSIEGHTLNGGDQTASSLGLQASLGYTAENMANKTSYSALSQISNDNTKYPSMTTIKTVVDNVVPNTRVTSTITEDSTEIITSGAVYSGLLSKADASNVYSKSEADTLLAAKANSADVYTKSETTTLLSDYYTKTETNTLLSTKADASDVYTKIETDNLLNNKENTSNKVTSLSTTSTDTEYPSAKCVYDAIENSVSRPTIVKDWTSTSIVLAKANENTVYDYNELTDLTISDYDVSYVETVFYFRSKEETESYNVTTATPGTIYYVKTAGVSGGVVATGEQLYSDMYCKNQAIVAPANTYYYTGDVNTYDDGGTLTVPSNVPHIGSLPIDLNNSYYKLTIQRGIFKLEEITGGQIGTIIAENDSTIEATIE